MSESKIFGVGLPRCAGQTLRSALSLLYPKNRVWHSPGNRWYKLEEKGNWCSAVEVFASPLWLETNFPGSIYIYNNRELDSWLGSCTRSYQLSQDQNWNHPLWRYPLSQFEDYYHNHLDMWMEESQIVCPGRVFIIDMIKYPNWVQLCDALNLPIPHLLKFPNVDITQGRPMRSSECKNDFTRILGEDL